AISSSYGHISILAFDACVMGGIETAYEYENYCDWYVASPNFEPEYGFPYDIIMDSWATNSSTGPGSLARAFADGWFYYYHVLNKGGSTGTWETLYAMKMPEAAAGIA